MNATPDAYYLSCYLTSPGRGAVLGTRHDQNVSLWRWGAAGVELIRLWELERLSGQKRHHWPLYSADRAEAFLAELLAEEQLGWSDTTAVWGTPGLPRSAELSVPAGGEDFAIHSLGHLFSGLLMDSELELRNDAEFTADDVNALAAYVRQTDQSFPFWVDQFSQEQGPAATFGSAQPVAPAGALR